MSKVSPKNTASIDSRGDITTPAASTKEFRKPRFSSQPRSLVRTRPVFSLATLLAADVLALAVASIVAFYAINPARDAILILIAASLAVFGAMVGSGMYTQLVQHPAVEMKRAALTSILVMLVVVGASVLFSVLTNQQNRLAIVFAGAISIALPMMRTGARLWLSKKNWWGRSALVVANPLQSRYVLQTLHRFPELGLKAVAVLNDDNLDNVLGSATGARFKQMDNSRRIPYVIIARPDLDLISLNNLRQQLQASFERVLVIPEPSSTGGWSTMTVHDALLVHGLRRCEPGFIKRVLKRGLDFVGSLIALVLLLPVLIVTAIIAYWDAGLPVLYKQQRLGQYGKVFDVWKFRTMVLNAEDELERILEEDPVLRKEFATFHKLRNDPRITRFGRIMRRFSLDELPQLFNVLEGDMSLVGPRAYIESEIPKMLDMEQEILSSKPGISGLWQVSGRNNLSFSERVWTDVTHARHCSFWLDVFLLAKTIPVVLNGEGAN